MTTARTAPLALLALAVGCAPSGQLTVNLEGRSDVPFADGFTLEVSRLLVRVAREDRLAAQPSSTRPLASSRKPAACLCA